MIFQVSPTSIAKRPYSFVIFQCVCVGGGGGGGPDPLPPSGSAHGYIGRLRFESTCNIIRQYSFLFIEFDPCIDSQV